MIEFARRFLPVLALIAALLTPLSAAHAQQGQGQIARNSGAYLIELCAGRLPVPSTPGIGLLACQNFIAGFLDYHALAAVNTQYRPFCVTPGATPADMQSALEGFARQNSERLEEHRSVVMFDALVAAYPCPEAPNAAGRPMAEPDAP